MKKTLLILFALLCFNSLLKAQDFPYGAISDEEMDMKSYPKDTSAHAVVLREHGQASIEVVTGERIKLVFEYHVKIKIFDNKGFDSGTVELPVYNYNEDADSYETIEELTGVTYYTDNNGATQKAELEKSKVYAEKENKNVMVYKFAMPAMKNGCVIEYRYRMFSPYLENFHPWQFQDFIPKINSEYEVHIPAYWRYNVSLKGGLKLTKNTSSVERNCFSVDGGGSGDGRVSTSVDCSKLIFGMSDVPAFVKEDYMTSARDFFSTINFELAEETNPYTFVKVNVNKEWKDVDLGLKKYLYFGSQLKKTALFKDRLVPVTIGKTDDLEKAKAIYSYVKQLFKYNGRRGKYSDEGIATAIDKHAGNDADINFSLINALNAAGFNAKAVLISTREHGKVNSLYPVVNDFDYLIARVDINNQTYLLDATDPLLPFGMLPMRCLNGRGRVFSMDGPSEWMDLNLPQKEKSTRTLDFTLSEDGKLKGTAIIYSTGYDAYEKRSAIKKFNSTADYIEEFKSKTPKIKVLKAEIIDVDSLDKPLIEKYDLEIDLFNKATGANDLAFNPFFWNKIDVNPFKLAERTYPVDMGMPSDERLTLTIHLPEQYTVATPPPVTGIAMPGNGGKFITNYEPGDHSFTFSHIIQFNKPVYDVNEYPYLKEFYNKIIQSEKAEILFKKKP
jgi:hypothetical protein